MKFFQQYNEFVELDNRQTRPHTPVTAETLTNKHEAMAPEKLVNGKSILDLGSCLGATGHWCLSHGAKEYTGVEFQKDYVEISNELLGKYWSRDQFTIIQDDLEKYLRLCDRRFDVVFACGIIYGFLNTHGILKLISEVADRCIVIDTSYPTELTHHRSPVIDIVNIQHMIKSDGEHSYMGLGARPSPAALHRMMLNLGFENKENLIFPKRLENKNIHDAYHDLIDREYGIKTPARFLMRFWKSDHKHKSAIENLLQDQNIVELPNKPRLIKETSAWEFDEEVAARFQKEAETHIPDYQKVINLSIAVVEEKFKNKDISVIDVGSALGHTVDSFISVGYKNVEGVEASKAMIEKSKHRERIIYSNSFPDKKYHSVLAHWTIHFIKEREKYLTDIYNNLEDSGILILTDKMTQDELTKKLYYDWKLSNGVSPDIVRIKEEKLRGILETNPLDWYLETLSRIGFRKVDLINSRFNFNTLLCFK